MEASFDKRKFQSGFSLVEMIITLAIMAILTGSTFTVIGYLRYANTTRVSTTIDDAINKLQIKSAAQVDKNYLYIYEDDGIIYYATLSDSDAYTNGSLTASAGTKLCNSAITVSYTDENGTSHQVSGSDYICVAYNKSYVFASVTNARVITVTNLRSVKTITLVMETGKHVLEE